MTSAAPATRPADHGPTDDGFVLEEPDLTADEPVLVDLHLVHLVDGVRVDGVDAEQVRLLAESLVPLPPVVLHRPSLRVVDGAHRVLAARQRGDARIPAVFVDGSDLDAFVLAVRLNSRHGLPLTRKDRRAAVRRIVAHHPEWSDRRIAALAGVSPKTVASVRNCSTEEVPRMTTRLGQDGRVRPVDPAEGRRQAAEELRRRPVASVREIAAVTGIAPGTVSDVRRRLQLGLDPVPHRACRAAPPEPGAVTEPAFPGGVLASVPAGPDLDRADVAGEAAARDVPVVDRSAGASLKRLTADPALRLTLDGRFLLRLLHAHAEGLSDSSRLARAVPPHRLATVARLAREFADGWTQLAESLEHPDAARAGGPGAGYGVGALRRDGTGTARAR